MGTCLKVRGDVNELLSSCLLPKGTSDKNKQSARCRKHGPRNYFASDKLSKSTRSENTKLHKIGGARNS